MGRTFGETIPQCITQAKTRYQTQFNALKKGKIAVETLLSVNVSYIVQSESLPCAETPQTYSRAMENIHAPLIPELLPESQIKIPKVEMSLHWPLMDPLVQDLDPSSRRYVFHCESCIVNVRKLLIHLLKFVGL